MAAPAPALPGVNADPHIAVFGNTFYLYPTTDGSDGWLSTSFRIPDGNGYNRETCLAPLAPAIFGGTGPGGWP